MNSYVWERESERIATRWSEREHRTRVPIRAKVIALASKKNISELSPLIECVFLRRGGEEVPRRFTRLLVGTIEIDLENM